MRILDGSGRAYMYLISANMAVEFVIYPFSHFSRDAPFLFLRFECNYVHDLYVMIHI